MSTIPTELPVPGFTNNGVTEATQQRDKEILFSAVGLIQKGGTVGKVAAAGEVVASGTVMARVTSTGKFKTYVDGGADGVGTAVAILRSRVDTSGGDALGNLIFGGDLKLDQLVGLDANAIADLNGRVDTVSNQFIF